MADLDDPFSRPARQRSEDFTVPPPPLEAGAVPEYVESAPEAFKRRWKTTWFRWLIFVGAAVLGGVVVILTIVYAFTDGSPSEALLDDVAMISATSFLYGFFVGWWADHLLARAGAVVAPIVHGVATLVFAPAYFGDLLVLSPSALAVSAAALTAASWLAVTKFPGSFAPKTVDGPQENAAYIQYE